MRKRELRNGLPPGPQVPAALQLMATWKRPAASLERLRAKYGKRITVQLPFQPPFVILSDPDEIKELFQAPPDVLHPGEGARVLEPLIGRKSVILLDEGAHLEQRRLMLPAFHGEKMQRLTGLMTELAEREVDSWPVGRPVALHPRLQRVTLEIVLRAVFGLEQGARLDELRDLLTGVLEFSENPLSVLPALQHAAGYGMELVETPLDDEGATDAEALAAAVDDDTAAVFVQQPNFLGTVEDLGSLVEAGKRTGAMLVCAADPIALSVLKPPGELGADLCVGEGQTLGNRLDFGGPSFGFFAADERFIRRMPGRIAGETRDVDGRRGFVLTLQTREQHIRREKATHNICTAQALNALAGVVYLSWLGKRGFVELGELLLRRTHYAREALGLAAINPGPVVREFAVRVPDLDGVMARAREAGINPGYRLARDYPEYPDGLLVAVTERRTKEHIDRLAEVIGAPKRAEVGV